MGIFKQHPFSSDPVDVRRLDEIIDRAFAVELLIKTGVAPHVIRKEKHNIGPLRFRRKGVKGYS